MKKITNIIVCLLIAGAASVLHANLAIAEDTETIIPGDTISSEPFEPDNGN